MGLLGQAAWAEPDQEPRWIPSIDFGFDTFAYSADGATWTPIATLVAQSGPSAPVELVLPGGLGSTIRVRVVDDDRSRKDTIADSVAVDWIAILST